MHYRNHHNQEVGEWGWSSFIAGALVGGGVALFLTPQAGTDLRGLLSNYVSRTQVTI